MTTSTILTNDDIDALIIDALRHRVGKDERAAKPHDWYTATVYALRDKVIDRWMESTRRTYDAGAKRVSEIGRDRSELAGTLYQRKASENSRLTDKNGRWRKGGWSG